MLKKEEIKEKVRNFNPVVKKCLAYGTVGVLSYKFGYRVAGAKIASGIEICWKKDPTLKEHMWNVMTEVMKDNISEQ